MNAYGAPGRLLLFTQEITGAPIGEAWLTGEACLVANGLKRTGRTESLGGMVKSERWQKERHA